MVSVYTLATEFILLTNIMYPKSEVSIIIAGAITADKQPIVIGTFINIDT